jgi:transcriptional accessory protein Tex/SPT6
VSEEIVIGKNPDAPVEETQIIKRVESPRSDGASQETPQAEAMTQKQGEVEASSQELAAGNGRQAEAIAETTDEAGEAERRKRRRRRRRRHTRAAPPSSTEVRVIPPKKIIKPLRRGLELAGTVRRLAEFGAFIDIGVGTDGLVHISELSPTRVGKVSDVLQEGQQVQVWIKDLDKEHNRISLTMIPPGTKTLRNLEEGDIVHGKVTRLVPYGAFVDIGVGRDAMLHVREMAEGYVAKPEDVVQVGEELEARVIAVDRRRQRIDLSLKGMRPEPAPPQPNPKPRYEEKATVTEEEDDNLPSVMAFAFQKAFGDDFKPESRRDRRPKRRRRDREDYDEEMDGIISRTLKHRDNY